MEKYLEGWENFLNELEAAPKAAVKSLNKFRKDMFKGGGKTSEPFTEEPFPKDFSKPGEFSAPPMAEGDVEEDILFKPLTKNQKAHSSKLIRIKYKDKPLDKDGIIDPKVAKDQLEEKWSEKYKRSIDCKHPKGFSQKAHCQGRKKNEQIELEEKKDRCYRLAKRKYKAFPSAYASGAIVKCRKGKIWKKEK